MWVRHCNVSLCRRRALVQCYDPTVQLWHSLAHGHKGRSGSDRPVVCVMICVPAVTSACFKKGRRGGGSAEEEEGWWCGQKKKEKQTGGCLKRNVKEVFCWRKWGHWSLSDVSVVAESPHGWVNLPFTVSHCPIQCCNKLSYDNDIWLKPVSVMFLDSFPFNSSLFIVISWPHPSEVGSTQSWWSEKAF